MSTATPAATITAPAGAIGRGGWLSIVAVMLTSNPTTRVHRYFKRIISACGHESNDLAPETDESAHYVRRSGLGGADATRHLLELDPAPKVLVVTVYDSDADILPAIEAGALGYLLKDAPPDQLLGAIQSAARDETVLAPRVAARLLRRSRTPRHRELTLRELEMLRHLARGLSNRAIAEELVVTEATVKSHLVHIYDKLGVDSRTAAVAAARERGHLPRD
jgi:DNA-binding NarL/FixJ family response regulator